MGESLRTGSAVRRSWQWPESGNLAISYKDFRYSEGLVRLGRIEGEIEALRQAGKVAATFEIASEATQGE